jgi:hypothetical protein
MMMVFLVLLGIEGLSYMLNDENKKRLPFKQPLFFEYRRYFLYSLWLLILIIKLPHRWK